MKVQSSGSSVQVSASKQPCQQVEGPKLNFGAAQDSLELTPPHTTRPQRFSGFSNNKDWPFC